MMAYHGIHSHLLGETSIVGRNHAQIQRESSTEGHKEDESRVFPPFVFLGQLSDQANAHDGEQVGECHPVSACVAELGAQCGRSQNENHLEHVLA